jgi:hypothetical protein
MLGISVICEVSWARKKMSPQKNMILPASGIRHPASGIRHPASGNPPSLFGPWWPVLGTRGQTTKSLRHKEDLSSDFVL